MSGYTYESFERGLWTVGHRDESGKWHAESDYDDPQAAADRVHYLNGGAVTPQPSPDPGAAMREAASRELTAAITEARGYREALQRIAKRIDDDSISVRIIARQAEHALEGQ